MSTLISTKCYIMKIEEMANELRDYYFNSSKSILADLLDGKSTLGNLSSISGLFVKDANGKYINSSIIIPLWCEKISDSFFNEYPNVDDLLVEICNDGNGNVIREWVASR